MCKLKNSVFLFLCIEDMTIKTVLRFVMIHHSSHTLPPKSWSSEDCQLILKPDMIVLCLFVRN